MCLVYSIHKTWELRNCMSGANSNDHRQGRGRGAHEVGVTWCMWPVHVGSLRAGEGHAHRGGGGGGERGHAGSRGRW